MWLTHLSGTPVCGGVYRGHLFPVYWACLRTGKVLTASTLCSDTSSEHRVHLGPSTAALPPPGWTWGSGGNRQPSSGLRDCPQAEGPPQDFQAAGSASPLGSTEWCGTPLDWRQSSPSPDCLGNIQTHVGVGLKRGKEKIGKCHWLCFLVL